MSFHFFLFVGICTLDNLMTTHHTLISGAGQFIVTLHFTCLTLPEAELTQRKKDQHALKFTGLGLIRSQGCSK